jgi:uncharacterized cupin superfamily protein
MPDQTTSAPEAGPVQTWLGSLDTAEFEPYVEDGVELGEVHWIRQEFGPDGDPIILVGIMRTDQGTGDGFEYTWLTDETIQVLEGRLEIDIPGSGTITLNPGDVGSFPQGKTAVFRPTPPYKQFFVMTKRASA